MDSTRWRRIQSLFHGAAGVPQAEQKEFLEAACGNDEELIGEVLAMLDQDASGSSLLDRRLADIAQETLAESLPAPLIPKEFGPYRILQLLGEGGMGIVYLAERKDLSTQVAVKILRDAWISPARRERFATEQRTLAQLNHPSIARLYDADTLEDGTPWFVMEYVDGIPLTHYCRTHACSVEQRCNTRTVTPSSTAISSRPTSLSKAMARSVCSISVLPKNWRVWTCKWTRR